MDDHFLICMSGRDVEEYEPGLWDSSTVIYLM